MEQIKKLEDENQSLKIMVETLINEKTALDQMYMEKVKNEFSLRAQLLNTTSRLQKITDELFQLKELHVVE